MTGTARRGRPPVNSGPLVAVTFDGLAAAWCSGVFAGNPDVVASARLSVELGETVWLGGALIVADDRTARGALAALSSYRPGRLLVTEAPADLLALVNGGGCGGEDAHV